MNVRVSTILGRHLRSTDLTILGPRGIQISTIRLPAAKRRVGGTVTGFMCQVIVSLANSSAVTRKDLRQ
jgi:hypothetical protein